MLITSLEIMEKVVSSNSDLDWDGWDVAKYTVSHNAIYSQDGVFRQGKWMKKKVFPLTEQGWHLPSNIGRAYAQVEG
jgi:hypothetical protein